MWRNFLERIFLVKTYKHLLSMAVSLWALYIFTEFRISSGWIFFLLPYFSLVVSLAGLVAFVQDLLGHDRDQMRVGPVLSKLEWWVNASVRVLVYGALFVFANAKLDPSPVLDRETVLQSLAGAQLDFTDSFPSLVGAIEDWEKPKHVIRLPLLLSERRTLWGGEHIAVRTRAGYFGVPWVMVIERDEAYYFREVLKLAPTATEAWKRLIHYYTGHQRWEDVVRTGQEYARLYPNDQEYLLWLGTSLGFAQRYAESIQILEDLAQRHPSYDVYQQLGWSLNWSGQSRLAAEVLEKSIPLDPDNFEAYYHLGYVYNDMAVSEKALTNFKRVLELIPHFPEVESKIAGLESIVDRERDLLSSAKGRVRQMPARQP